MRGRKWDRLRGGVSVKGKTYSGMERKTQKRLEKLMMRDVASRFALLYQWGLGEDMIVRTDLEGTPNSVAFRLSQKVEYYYGENGGEMDFVNKVSETPLPDGIPE